MYSFLKAFSVLMKPVCFTLGYW